MSNLGRLTYADMKIQAVGIIQMRQSTLFGFGFGCTSLIINQFVRRYKRSRIRFCFTFGSAEIRQSASDERVTWRAKTMATVEVVFFLICSLACAPAARAGTIQNFTQMAASNGLECEQYEVTTDDGYVLTLFRLPGNSSRPVLLLSGAFGSADDYIARGNTSLPAVLARAGRDVWLGNVRGSRYGMRHRTLDPAGSAFWDFSFHEYSVSDLPAIVDFVLNNTEQQKLSHIGWSLGTTGVYVLGSERPEYAAKFRVSISLAPICYMHHSPAQVLAALTAPLVMPALALTGTDGVFVDGSLERSLVLSACSSPATAYGVCMQALYPVYGYDADEMEPEYAVKFFEHYPSSMSRKALTHLAQTIQQRRFQKYDYGLLGNLRKYGSLSPPEYALGGNNISVVLVSGRNDLTSTLPDVALLRRRLGGVRRHIVLEPAKFNHIDFAHGINTHSVLFEPIILSLLEEYDDS
ncbi:lipase 3-like [Ostrinia furnacalis]|uniref:lipase 3-like n=1 Tax=Ostrinia furnacalis TaxID=93504 RepID=UPI0010400E5B|nr:lipase 3-like [Ostrinia furnacalis]